MTRVPAQPDAAGPTPGPRPPLPEHALAESVQATVDLLAELAGVPIASMQIVDDEREHSLAFAGCPFEGDRIHALCGDVVDQDRTLVVPDVAADKRFRDHPGLRAEGIRFYAGTAVHDESGRPIGTLCVRDRRPRSDADDVARIVERLVPVLELQIRAHLDLRRHELLRASFDAAADGVVWIDEHGAILHANASAAAMFETTTDDLVGRPVHERLGETEVGSWTDLRHETITRGDAVARLRPDGGPDASPLEIEVRTTAVDAPHGTLIAAFLHDRTDELARSREIATAATALDAIDDCVFLFDPRTLRFVRSNTGATRQVGWSAEELRSMTPVDLKPGFDRASFERMIAPLRDGTQSSLRFRTVHRHRGGREIPVEVLLQFVPDLGQCGLFIAVVRDRTEEQRREQHVEELAARLRAAVDAAGIGVWAFDLGAQTVVWDETMCRIFGLSAGAGDRTVPYATFRDSVHADDLEDLERRIDGAITRGEPLRTIFRIRRADGVERWVSAAATVLRDADGTPRRMVGVNVDETERVLAERATEEARRAAEHANEAKSRFLANMSHEIRTPMTAILGFGELLEGPEGEDRTRRSELVSIIRRNGEHLIGVLNDILDLSKIEAGRLTIESVPLDPVALVEQVAGLLGVQAEQRGIELRTCVRNDPPSAILGDPVRFRQVVANLVGNAVKFTEAGHVTVEIDWCAGNDAAEGTLAVEVRDSGIGLTAEQLRRVFEPFAQADDSMTRRFGGSGLGLPIAVELARLMGGDIHAESEPGRGSVFALRIAGRLARAVPTPEAGGPDPAAVSPGDGPPLAGRRILLAEDGPDNRRLIEHLLRTLGAEVAMAEDGLLAVTAWQSAREGFDLVLMDMQMPGMDGYAAAARLRELGCSAPIVALTAHAMSGDRQRCLDAGCSDYLTKPITRDRLLAGCLRALAPGDVAAAAHDD